MLSYTVLAFCMNARPTTETYTLSLHDALPILSLTFDALFNFALVQEDHGLIGHFLFDQGVHAAIFLVYEVNFASFVPVANRPGAFAENAGPLPVRVVVPEYVPDSRSGRIDSDVEF